MLAFADDGVCRQPPTKFAGRDIDERRDLVIAAVPPRSWFRGPDGADRCCWWGWTSACTSSVARDCIARRCDGHDGRLGNNFVYRGDQAIASSELSQDAAAEQVYFKVNGQTSGRELQRTDRGFI